MPSGQQHAAGVLPRRLCFYTGGFWREKRVRRILNLAGHELSLGWPGKGDGVVVWGQTRHAHRGVWVAAKTGATLFRVEDAFLRSVRPGRMGEPPLGLIIDPIGLHFDPSRPSLLETMLNTQDFTKSNISTRASAGIARLMASDISKYNMHDQSCPLPAPGYVLVIDQTQGDASLPPAAEAKTLFKRMLAAARSEHPGARIVIKAHPETTLGLRPGHFGPSDLQALDQMLTAPVSPWRLVEGARAVYTVSSQLGMEAVFAGQTPRVFGQPFYAGWGLTADERPLPRRGRNLTREDLFAAAMLLAPTWYDPCRDRLCSFEEAMDQLEAETRAYREDHRGHLALGMRLWKRAHLQSFFGRQKPVSFVKTAPEAYEKASKSGKSILVWAGKEAAYPPPPAALRLLRVEDGFLRSRGLGAQLVPAMSLVADDLGIYYDPNRESRLERLIKLPLPPEAEERALRLRDRIVAQGVTKYNLAGEGLPKLGPGRRILIPGQVEDDASIRLGAGEIRTNLALLQAVAAANPEAVLIYKPHPDVEAGLRPGHIEAEELRGLASYVARSADTARLLAEVDEVWTMTSLLGFEALLRGLPVTCLGAPFYAGWGLTRDLGPIPSRRKVDAAGLPAPRPNLASLIHASLIAYPRYHDPISGLPCPPEVILDRLDSTGTIRQTKGLRLLSKLQGMLATQAHWWR
jgi:capsular polysaccharide export protein